MEQRGRVWEVCHVLTPARRWKEKKNQEQWICNVLSLTLISKINSLLSKLGTIFSALFI